MKDGGRKREERKMTEWGKMANFKRRLVRETLLEGRFGKNSPRRRGSENRTRHQAQDAEKKMENLKAQNLKDGFLGKKLKGAVAKCKYEEETPRGQMRKIKILDVQKKEREMKKNHPTMTAHRRREKKCLLKEKNQFRRGKCVRGRLDRRNTYDAFGLRLGPTFVRPKYALLGLNSRKDFDEKFKIITDAVPSISRLRA